ncbi:MAG: hypothetical protein ACOC7S_01900 [Planctomycetota bacterium]
MLRVSTTDGTDIVKPLERVSLSAADGAEVSVRDGRGREYARLPAEPGHSFAVGGALGHHMVSLLDEEGRTLDSVTLRVDCHTEITDAGGRFEELLAMTHNTLILQEEVARVWYEGRLYKMFTSWVRDHVHALKGLKWFSPYVKDAMDFFAQTQREDGMVWDGVFRRPKKLIPRDVEFAYGNFVRPFPDGTAELQRLPIENDCEYLYVEGIYYSWKATGDSAWMASLLESAIEALRYSRTDPYRWSEKFGLLKRGFTIDTWDYQPGMDEEITGHCMVIDKDRTHFGVMHGDNTGYAMACGYLAEMLEHVGREDEAAEYRQLADEIVERLDDVAWNGRFYTHHVTEDPEFERDLGVDQSRQVSLSNAYALNRTANHEQCAAIIREYQRIREEMPETGPAEWYSIYPPFPKGFERHQPLWGYVNGGVLTLVAGELARGAFEHGFEDYAVDILERLRQIGRAHDGEIACVLKGKMPEPPDRNFQTVDLRGFANRDFADRAPGQEGGSGAIDLRGVPTGEAEFADIPFDVPAGEGEGAMVGLSARPSHLSEATIPVNGKAGSLYFLHAVSGGGPRVGDITLAYADGSRHREHIYAGRQVLSWWFPVRPFSRKRMPVVDIGWEGSNDACARFGVTVYGLDNPHPEKEVTAVELCAGAEVGLWCLLGLTLCDAEHFMMPPDVSFGPVKWCTGAVAYALIEGLVGAVDTGVAFDRLRLTPRWEAAGVDMVTACARYEASGGYVRYSYARERDTMTLELTGNADRFDVELLLPEGALPRKVEVDGEERAFEERRVEDSVYVSVPVRGVGVHSLRVETE